MIYAIQNFEREIGSRTSLSLSLNHINLNVCVCTQNMTIGLNLYLGSQSICVVGLGFPNMGDPILGNLSTLLFP